MGPTLGCASGSKSAKEIALPSALVSVSLCVAQERSLRHASGFRYCAPRQSLSTQALYLRRGDAHHGTISDSFDPLLSDLGVYSYWLDDSDDVKFGVPGLTQFAPLLPENYSQLNRLQAFIERFTRPA